MSKRGQASRQLVERSHTLTCEVGTDTMCLKKGQKKGQNNVSEKGTDTTCLKKYGDKVSEEGAEEGTDTSCLKKYGGKTVMYW